MWNVQVQNKALERHAAGTLFPNQQEVQSGADEPVDLFGQLEGGGGGQRGMKCPLKI